MAHFAELDSNNKVLKVVVACDQDIANNGGEQSVEAATHFQSVLPLTPQGTKYVQTSYNNNFRGHFAGVSDVYDATKDLFITDPQPYASWTLNESTGWYDPPYDKPDTIRAHIWDETAYQADNTKGWDCINADAYSWDSENETWVQKEIATPGPDAN